MIIRAIDGDNDWMFGKGKQSYLSGQEAVGENIKTRLQCFINNCFFDMNAGIDWIRLLGTKGTETEIILTCRAIILQSYGVVKVNSILPLINSNRNLTLSYNINSVFTNSYAQQLEVINV
jgi:hypothetical protein